MRAPVAAMAGNGDETEAAERPASDVLCGTLFLLPGATALAGKSGRGGAKREGAELCVWLR
ncbi:hypothetical protein BwSH20_50530 [Bradyrhizobium ottawaense]|nr:hypothetical protein SG09_67550 [Bradyrhizobium ottawaense]GMO24889.1 hypothetical protein BwSF12_19890 [Bradyrhizobium ottawaense]GMO37599.1 hypothetical protein BwSF21_45960 [Bradyrhizobium ottawaense]GMO49584.1 hypothetical protein BwSH14_69820 [Bradyrhizobium ottawaense]GMO62896.1 hypothetical protein BwSG20_19900 [Bradyrhizobium ottawaense]